MLYRKRSKILLTLDIIEIIVSLLGIVAFTLCFRFYDDTLIKTAFLAIDLAVVFSLGKTLSNLEFGLKSRERITKNSNVKIESKYIKKIHA